MQMTNRTWSLGVVIDGVNCAQRAQSIIDTIIAMGRTREQCISLKRCRGTKAKSSLPDDQLQYHI